MSKNNEKKNDSLSVVEKKSEEQPLERSQKQLQVHSHEQIQASSQKRLQEQPHEGLQGMQNLKSEVPASVNVTAPVSQNTVSAETVEMSRRVQNNRFEGESGIDVEQKDKKTADKSEEKKKRPASVSLKDKSEQFKLIIDIALEYEKLEEEHKKLKSENKILTENCKNLTESLKESEKLCADRLAEIEHLQSDVAHRNEVIDIVKADKSESSQEYKNALAAALKIFHSDFMELKTMEMTADVGAAMADTLESVFEILEKNGIAVSK